jgi:hypothetical protein
MNLNFIRTNSNPELWIVSGMLALVLGLACIVGQC